MLLFAAVLASNIGIHLAKSSFGIIPLTLATVLSLAGWRVRYQDISPALGILIRGICATIVIYLLLAYPFFVGEEYEPQPKWFRIAVVSYFFYGAMLFGIGGLFRPTLALLPCIFLMVLKRMIGRTTGIGIISTDYVIIPEMGMLAVSGILIYSVYVYISSRQPRLPAINVNPVVFSSSVFFCIIAVHFANYFYAGIEKLFLDGPWLSWIWNETPNLMLVSFVQRTNPLATWPAISDFAYESFSRIYPFSNALILLVQLVSFAALARKASMIAFIVFYDVMHVAIFVASGILFWNWIILNIILVIGLSQIGFNKTSRPLLIFGIFLLIVSPKFFTVESLGWYDSREINLDRVVAILDDGETVDLPLNFFRNHSVAFAQNSIDARSVTHIDIWAAGETKSYDRYKLSYECGVEILGPSPDAREPVGPQFFPGYFKHIRAQLDEDGRLSFNTVPHHIWANPALYEEASNLDARRVVAVEHFRDVICVEPGSTPTSMKARTLSSAGRRYEVKPADE